MDGKHQHFIRSVTAVSAAHQAIADPFFVRRLNSKLEQFVETYLAWAARPEIPSLEFEHRKSAESLIDLLEELRHLNQGRALPLSVAQDRLLRYQLLLLKNRPPAIAAPAETKPAKIKKEIVLPERSALSSTAEKIVGFVRRTSSARTKDIIGEFSVLSERTVKRSLKELTRKGILKKTMKDRAMYYLVN